MNLRINAGYIITDSIHIGEYEFVLGVSQHIANDFVTWRCNDGNYYYWGHYHDDLFSAQKDLVERATDKVRELQEVLEAKKAMEPTFSPWGEVQTCKELCHGVYSVSTARHGGLMAHLDVADKVFSVAARKCGFTEGRYLCFEEDCDEQVALRELMDKKLFKVPVNDRFPPGQYEKGIDASIQAYHPDYWNFRKTHLLKALENSINAKKKGKERER